MTSQADQHSRLDAPGADDGVVAVGAVLAGAGSQLHLLHVAAPEAQDPADLGPALRSRQRAGVQVQLEHESHALILPGGATSGGGPEQGTTAGPGEPAAARDASGASRPPAPRRRRAP